MIDITGMTLQQVSDAIASKVIGQGGQCLNERGDCLYGDGNGKHCAIGWLLSESSPFMAYESSVHELIASEGFNDEHNKDIMRDNVDALSALQELHVHLRGRLQISQSLVYEFDLNMDAWSEWIEMGDA